MLAKIKRVNSDLKETEKIAQEKRNKRGAFDKRIFLISTKDIEN